MGCVVGVPCVSHADAACPPPQDYVNQTSVQDGDILVSFAADKRSYPSGEPVRFYLSFENTGTDSVHIPSPYSPEYKIRILPDTCLTVKQPGCDTLLAPVLPEVVLWFSPGIGIGVGDCYVRSVTWNDTTSSFFPPDPGDYRVFGGMPGFGDEFSVPAGGAVLLLTVTKPTDIRDDDPSRSTWGRIKAFYRQP
jgi:hypothetical protein